MQDFFWGLNSQSIAIFTMILCYILLFSEKFNRAAITLLLGAFLVISGIVTKTEAINYVDFNTIALLIGMMIMINVAELSGMFQFAAVWGAKKVKAKPVGILLFIGVITAVLSAFLDNVTTVLLIVPVIMQIAKKLEVNPYPFLLINIFAANIGGTASLIGDPPNILIGSALNLSFNDFLFTLAPIAIIIMLSLIAMFYYFWKDSLIATKENRELIMSIDAKDEISDFKLLFNSLAIFSFVILGFIFAKKLGLNNGFIALLGAALMLLTYTFKLTHNLADEKVEGVLNNIDWITIFFFVGLFVIVGGLDATGVLDTMGHKFINFTDGNIAKSTYIILGLSSVFSAMIDNIPFVATMIPMLQEIEESLGGREATMPLWWALSLGACLGGNGSLIGASANVVVAGIASREGQPLNFARFLIWSIPVTFMSILISAIFLYIKYFI